MKIVALVVVLGLVLAMGWQHRRYLAARRGPVQDQQSLFYGGATLHVVSFLRSAEGADVLEDLRKLRNDVEASGRAKIVYAGRAAPLGLESSQLGEADWDAVVLVQYPSRDAYHAAAASAAHRDAFGRFEAALNSVHWRFRGLPPRRSALPRR